MFPAFSPRGGAPPPPLVVTLLTLAIASAGGGAFALLGAPARVPDLLRDGVLFGLGVSMGGSVTPETLGAMARWPASVAMLVVTMLAVMVAVTLLLRRAGWDRDTAILASAPGALSTVLALAAASGLDARRVVVVQCVRLIALVAFVPSLVWAVEPIGGAAPAAHPAGWFPESVQWLVLLAASALGALALKRTGAPAPLMIGALVGSALLHGPGIVTTQVPNLALAAGFTVLGAFIALRFQGVTRAELARDFGLAIAALAVAVVLSALGALATVAVTGLPAGPVVIAFAPGGVEAMIGIAFALDLDPAYVGSHHVLRFVLIALLLPLVMRRLGARSA
jgi:uncharacterized protein